MENSGYIAEWEIEAKRLATQSASRIWILASIVVPFFALFEYGYGIDQFRHFLTIFLCISLLMLLVVLIQKKYPLPSLIQIYGVSVILACCFGYMAAYTNINNVHNYLMGVSAITMVRGMIYFGKVIHLIIVTGINHFIAYTLLFLVRPEPVSEIPDIQSTLFFGVIFMIFSFAGMHVRYKLTYANFINSRKLNHSLTIIEEKQKEIMDSINYAERIQRSFLATKDLLDRNLKDYFVLFMPKDVVSGDFYWASRLNDSCFAVITADSTGHGVPGAIMSLLNVTSLEKAVETETEPSAILNATRRIIIERLKKDGSEQGGKDGMDCSLCVYDLHKEKLKIAAANNPVWIVRGTEVIEMKPDKMPVGKHNNDAVSFTQKEFDLQNGDVVYTLTDGFPDQFGGRLGKKFMSKNLRELLLKYAHLPMQEQKIMLENTLRDWIGKLEQVDDVTLIGIKI